MSGTGIAAMISVHLNGHRFQVRAAAIFLHEGHLLVHRAPTDGYWTLPGGRVEVGEAAAATIVREIQEELGETVECGRLLHISENFFDLADRRSHEIGFYFLAFLADGSARLDRSRSHDGIEPGLGLEFRWVPISDLAGINLRPTFLQTSLAANPLVFSHEVQREYP